MLILVLGQAGSGKSFFTEHKLFPYVGNSHIEVISEPTPAQLKNSDILEQLKDKVYVIEVQSDKDVPQDLRARADLFVFMTNAALGAYFDRIANDVADLRNQRAYSAVKSICGVGYTPVVFDPNAKRFIVHYD